jgi:tetratricopeptide (TPR) repeat protein
MSAASSWAARGLGCGAEGEIKGALLAIQAGVYVGQGRYDDVLALGDEALALLPPGGKRWYMAFQQLFTVVTLAHPEGLLTLAPRLMSVEPSPEASGHYIRAAAWLVASLGMIGAKEEMGAVMERMKHHLAGLDQSDASAWGHYCAALTSHYQLIEERPWRRAQSCKKGCEGYREADLRRDQYMMDVYYGKALQDLGDYAQAEVVLRANLAQAEQLNEPFSIIMAKIHVARLLAAAATPDKLDEAYRLTEDAIHLKGIVADVARETRAEIKLRQGDAASAEQEASMACNGMTATPAYKWPAVALWTWSLLEQGRSAEALEVSEEGVREIERLGLEGHGEVGLRLARAEARWATGQEEAARDALLKTLEQLRLRVDDIPDAAARVRYLTVIPANVRLLTRAKEWLGDEVVRSFMVASDGG